MTKHPASSQASPSARQESLLKAAVQVFARHGYRKTSLEQVARAAGWSRQGLYLYYASKEALFQATVEYALASQLRAALDALARDGALGPCLVEACDEWAGRHVGVGQPDAADLAGASASLSGGTVGAYNARFERAVAGAIAKSPAMKTYAAARLSALSVARTLLLAVQGLKERSETRQAFRTALKTIVAVLLAH